MIFGDGKRIPHVTLDNPMKESKYSHFTKRPPDNRRCTAKSKRSQQRCKNWAMRERAVCRFHGGKSYRGLASPRYVHGYYSKSLLARAPWIWYEQQLRIEKYIAAEMERIYTSDHQNLYGKRR